MGFFKDVAFGASKKWEIARHYYGDDIARELYYLPNSEPLSLMNEAEKAALRVVKYAGRLNDLQNKALTKVSEGERREMHKIAEEVNKVLGDDSIVSQQYSKDPRLEWHNSIQHQKSEKAKQKWQHRLELFKKNGSVEED
ncbi:hypothetical protein IKF02_00485 [Candidatus Saccharibacteria bacterium]|nr:hypothetical protein [Candidatus Saccharibacteria bacterium]